MTLILSRQDVMQVLQMKDCINVVEKAFSELTSGTAILPLRTAITPAGGLSLYMPAYLKNMQALACKVVTVYKENPLKHNLPTTIGKVLLQDPETGDVKCIMDGGYLTAVRTGAASGVATKYLVPEKESFVVGLFGTGVQAKMQLWAVSDVVKIKKVLVFDISDDMINRFIPEMTEKHNLQVEKAENSDHLVMESDIIITASSSSTPVFNGKLLKPGTHINGIGSHTPNARELDSDTIIRSRFIGDSREACFAEAGDIMIPVKEGLITAEHFYAEIGEVINGVKTGRAKHEQDIITLFKSNGLAIQDAATAKLVFERAVEKGIGLEVQI
jgi:ornithine cyclodeaminase/alanine dehydrogenase